MKIMFLYPNVLMCSRIPLSLGYLVSVAKKAEWDVCLFDTTFMKEGDELSDDDRRYETFQVKKADLSEYGADWEKVSIEQAFEASLDIEKPDLIAVSLTENMLPLSRKLLPHAKERDIPVVAGGILPTTVPEEIINYDWVDVVCVGEGEGALSDLLKNLSSNKPVDDIENLWVKDSTGVIHKNRLRALIQLDEMPYQDWGLFSDKHIWRPLGGKVYRTGNFLISKGCPNRCTFCVNNHLMNLYKDHGRYLRRFSVDRIIGEVKYFKEKYELNMIQFHDENFLLAPKKFITDLMDKYKKEIDLPFSIVTHANTVSDFSIKTIVDAGCINLSMSIESGSPEIRKTVFNRDFTNEKIIEAFKTAKKYGLRVSTSNIIGNPTEDRSQIFETIMLNRACEPDAANVNMLYPFKGTEIYDYCISNKLYDPEKVVGDGGVRMESVLDLPQITKEELNGLQRTFHFYLRFPEDRFCDIEIAEKFDDRGNEMFAKLSKEFSEKFSHLG